MAEENTDTSTDESPEGQSGETGQPAEDALAEAGRKAIAAERAKAKSESQKRRLAETELAALKASLEKKAESAETVDPKAIAETAKAEVRAEILKDRALDKVEVLAAKTFANPALAAKLLASDVDSFVDDGKVDVEAINDALKALLEAEPYLAAAPAKRFQGSADQGPRNSKPNDIDAQIAAAAAKGDVMAQIRLQNAKLIPQIQRMQGVKP